MKTTLMAIQYIFVTSPTLAAQLECLYRSLQVPTASLPFETATLAVTGIRSEPGRKSLAQLLLTLQARTEDVGEASAIGSIVLLRLPPPESQEAQEGAVAAQAAKATEDLANFTAAIYEAVTSYAAQ